MAFSLHLQHNPYVMNRNEQNATGTVVCDQTATFCAELFTSGTFSSCAVLPCNKTQVGVQIEKKNGNHGIEYIHLHGAPKGVGLTGLLGGHKLKGTLGV